MFMQDAYPSASVSGHRAGLRGTKNEYERAPQGSQAGVFFSRGEGAALERHLLTIICFCLFGH